MIQIVLDHIYRFQLVLEFLKLEGSHILKELLITSIFSVHIVFLLLVLEVLNKIYGFLDHLIWLRFYISVFDHSYEGLVEKLMVRYYLDVASTKMLRHNHQLVLISPKGKGYILSDF